MITFKSMNSDSNCYIIAEISANHNQDYELTLDTIKACKNSGADAVKFQTYTPDSLSIDTDNEYFGAFKSGLWKGKRPYDLYKEAAMPWEWQKGLSEYAMSIGLDWLSSPFDHKAVDFLDSLNIPAYKLASLEITDIPLIEHIASKGKPIIISTGVAEIEDIEAAIEACRRKGNEQVSLLKCTSQYPAPIEAANMITLPDMKKRFGLTIGLSDHTPGSIVPVVAVSLGAKIIEKHFILDRSIGGPDAAFSMEPSEFGSMVKDVRDAEKALGKVDYQVTEKDRLRRRSLFVVKDVKKGERITKENVRSVRPGHGLHPKYLEKILTKKFAVDVTMGTPLDPVLIKD